MLDSIKKIVMASYSPNEAKWLFVSLFDASEKLLLSNGVVSSDKTLEMSLETLYHGVVEKNLASVKKVYIDVVTSLRDQNDMEELLSLPLTEYGIALSTVDWTKSAVMLPNTAGVADVKQALAVMKQKHDIEWNVLFFVFQTERFIVDKDW